jgi:hypothetical protein
MKDTKKIGDATEAMILARLLQKGEVVLTPFGDSQRFDLVIYRDEKFIRVQCKTGKIQRGALTFRTASVHKNQGNYTYLEKGYRGQADIFMVYCSEIDKFYSVPVDLVPESKCYLRLDAPKQNRQTGIRWAKDFEF